MREPRYREYREDVDEKLMELQEAMQKLQLLKQIGAEKLVTKQENEIYTIQQDLMKMDDNTTLDAADAILPKKCRFCPDKLTSEDKIDCYETNFETCEHKEPQHIGLLSMSILRIVITYIALLLLLFTFLLLTNIFSNYFDDRWLIFLISSSLIIIIIIVFYKPMKKLLAMVS